jgi:type VI secretion system secreted protein VgrG
MTRMSFGLSFKRLLIAVVFAAVATFGASPAARAADGGRNEEIKQRLTHDAGLQKSFPRLGTNFEVLRARTKSYNCIAWSLGVTDHWVNPETGPEDAPLRFMDRLYAEEGYRRAVQLNWRLERGLQKVVVYATLNPDATINEVTHAARQEPDGTFTSKLGQLPLIRHATPEDLRGPLYGLPIAVYVRPAHVTPE